MCNQTDSNNTNSELGFLLAKQSVQALNLAISLAEQASPTLLSSADLKTARETGVGAQEISVGGGLESFVMELREALADFQARLDESHLESMRCVEWLWEDVA